MSAATRLSTGLDFVEEYAAAAERLAVAVAWADLRAPVAGCPRWSTYDLVVHVGNVHAWAATIVETGRAAAEQNDEPAHAKPRTVSAWYAGKAEDLYEVLRGADPDAPCWNFAFGSGTVAFWPRRQLHETTIHHLDLEATRGRTPAVDPAVARDGVDEVLRVFLHRMHTRGRPAALGRPLGLTASDTGDSWVVAPAPRDVSTPVLPAQPVRTRAESVPTPPPVVTRGPAVPADVTDRVEAPAEVLYRLLWKRLAIDDAMDAVDAVDAGGTGDTGTRLSGDEARVRAFLASPLVP